MNIVKIDDAKSNPNAHNVEAKKLFDKDFAQIVHIKLNKGESLKRHITHTNVLFYILEGKGIVEIGDEKCEVEEGSLIESPDSIVHCWYNNSNEVLRILVIKTPRPEKASRIL